MTAQAQAPTERDFREVNPLRHGRDDSTLCYVCGSTPEKGSVFCLRHRENFDYEWDSDRRRQGIIHWTLTHPDFNGYDLEGNKHEPHIYPALPTVFDHYELLRMRDP